MILTPKRGMLLENVIYREQESHHGITRQTVRTDGKSEPATLSKVRDAHEERCTRIVR
jgi:hypothetical protein